MAGGAFDKWIGRSVEAADLLTAAPIERLAATPAASDFRARAPLYVGEPSTLAMAGRQLWITDEGGAVTMTAEIDAA